MAKAINIMVPPSLEELQRSYMKYSRKDEILQGTVSLQNRVFRAKERKKRDVIVIESTEAAEQIVKRWHSLLNKANAASMVGAIKRDIRAGLFNQNYFDQYDPTNYFNQRYHVQCTAYTGNDPTNNQTPPIFRSNCITFNPNGSHLQQPTFSDEPTPSLGWFGSADTDTWTDKYVINAEAQFNTFQMPIHNHKKHLFFTLSINTQINASYIAMAGWPRPAFFLNDPQSFSWNSGRYPKIQEYRTIKHHRRYIPIAGQNNYQWQISDDYVFSWNQVPGMKNLDGNIFLSLLVCHFPPGGRFFGPNTSAKVRSIISAKIFALK
jgi:hypothetical protein